MSVAYGYADTPVQIYYKLITFFWKNNIKNICFKRIIAHVLPINLVWLAALKSYTGNFDESFGETELLDSLNTNGLIGLRWSLTDIENVLRERKLLFQNTNKKIWPVLDTPTICVQNYKNFNKPIKNVVTPFK